MYVTSSSSKHSIASQSPPSTHLNNTRLHSPPSPHKPLTSNIHPEENIDSLLSTARCKHKKQFTHTLITDARSMHASSQTKGTLALGLEAFLSDQRQSPATTCIQFKVSRSSKSTLTWSTHVLAHFISGGSRRRAARVVHNKQDGLIGVDLDWLVWLATLRKKGPHSELEGRSGHM